MENTKEKTTDTIQKSCMNPAELMQLLTAYAVELFALGVDADADMPKAISNAMHPIAAAWGLKKEIADDAVRTVDAQRRVTINHKAGDEYPLVIDDDRVFHVPDGKEILSVTGILIESMVRLEQREEQQAIAQLISYLKDYWGIEDFL